jgi:hypothetical protein
LKWFDFLGMLRRGSPLVPFEDRQRPFSRTDLPGMSNEVGILKIMQVF